MTTNPTHIPEPTSPTAVAVGKRNGETVVAMLAHDDDYPWVAQTGGHRHCWRSWTGLRRDLTDIRVVDVAEVARPTKVAGCARCDRIEAHALGIEGLLGRRRDQLAKAREEIDQLKARIDELGAAKPEPGPWLRGDELAAIMPTLKVGDVVEVDWMGRTVTGELQPDGPSCLLLWALIVRRFDGRPGVYVDALRIIERAPEPEPEPGADIPDEVVAAAVEAATREWDSGRSVAYSDAMRLAIAAADAKRAELTGGEQP